jgi:hypothetical protein
MGLFSGLVGFSLFRSLFSKLSPVVTPVIVQVFSLKDSNLTMVSDSYLWFLSPPQAVLVLSVGLPMTHTSWILKLTLPLGPAWYLFPCLPRPLRWSLSRGHMHLCRHHLWTPSVLAWAPFRALNRLLFSKFSPLFRFQSELESWFQPKEYLLPSTYVQNKDDRCVLEWNPCGLKWPAPSLVSGSLWGPIRHSLPSYVCPTQTCTKTQ